MLIEQAKPATVPNLFVTYVRTGHDAAGFVVGSAVIDHQPGPLTLEDTEALIRKIKESFGDQARHFSFVLTGWQVMA